MKKNRPLNPHPRLYLPPRPLDSARLDATPFLQRAVDTVRKQANAYARMPPLRYPRDRHNAHLIRAREVQTRVFTLLAQWKQTGRKRFRDAAVAYVRQIAGWEYWSWITWRSGNAAPDAIFDLSYGENSATLAVAYDWLYDSLTPEEKTLFLDAARSRPIRSALKWARPGKAWWFGKPDSNWNTVCAGGLGMLCLSMVEDLPEARTLLSEVQKSIRPFIRHLEHTSGGWPEGIGYWNYGFRYAFMYLLSHETSTGRSHPLLNGKAVRATLRFPLDFSPNGVASGFGDANGWKPLPIHLAMAKRLGCADVTQQIVEMLAGADVPPSTWPDAAEWLSLYPPKCGSPANRPGSPVVKLYGGIDWGLMADRMPDPQFYVSVRGGSSAVPHGNRDLLSFNCVVGREKLVANIAPTEYLDSTFSSRRDEIFEVGPFSKNALLVNGVGITAGSSLDRTDMLRVQGFPGIRMDATHAMGTACYDKPAVSFCGRVFLLLPGPALLIVDRLLLPHVGRVESRIHTFGDTKLTRNGATIRGKKERLRIAYASNIPAALRASSTAPTNVEADSATLLRWGTRGLEHDIVLAALLTPGASATKLLLTQRRSRIVVTVTVDNTPRCIVLSNTLRSARGKESRN